MASFAPFRLPEYEVPKNAMLDFSPFAKAVENYRDGQVTQAKLGMEQKRLGMDEERLGLQKAADQRQQESHGDERKVKLAQQFAGIGQMILEEKDPARQNEMYSRLIASDPRIKDNLGKHIPKELMDDPVVASKYFIATARGYVNPLDDEAKRADIALKQANASKAQREAAQGPERYGKDIKLFVDAEGRTWGVQAGGNGELKYHRMDVPGQTGTAPPSGGQSGATPNTGAGPAADSGSSPTTVPQSQPLTPSRGVFQSGNQLRDKSTGRVVDSVDDAIRGEVYTKETTKAVVEDIGKRAAGIQASRDKLPRLQVMSDLVGRPDVYQGTGADAVLEFKKGAKALGFNVDGIPASEAIRSIGNQVALQLRNPAGGEGMPGALSDSDRQFLVQSTASLTNTQQGNQLILRVASEMEQYKIAQHNAAVQYLDKHKSQVGLSDYLQLWADKNPALSQGTRDMISKVTGVKYGASPAANNGWSITKE